MKSLFATIALYCVLITASCLLVNPAHAQEYTSGVYTLICKTSGLALDNEGSTSAGNPVWQWSPQAGNKNQEWEITSLGNGYYNLVCVASGMALDNDNGTSNGASVIQWTPEQGNTNQEWSITSTGNGYYQFVSRTSGLALDNSGATGNGGTVWQWSPQSGNTNQEWLITSVPTVLPGTVQAENYAPGGQGVGYSIGSVNGSANSYRGDGVDLETTSDTGGGYDVGWSSAGQWFRYNVNVQSAQTYPVAFRVANGTGSNATFHLANSAGTNLGEITVPPTGGWQTWITVTGTIALPAGVQTLTLDEDSGGFNVHFFTVASLIPTSFPAVVVPEYGIGQVIVAAATPQEYGAVANGTTDCTTAFQNAINSVESNNEGGGGVVFVPPGKYYFSGSLSIPTGVTLQGDWVDWTTGTNGAVGTILMATANSGNGSTSATPFISLQASSALRDVSIWYPNQSATSIKAYPFTISEEGDDAVAHDIALVNSYQGFCDLPSYPNNGAKFILSTIVGTPLFMGIEINQVYDVSHADDVRFSPNAWAVSKLTGAPAAGGAYATWMLANGTGIQSWRMDGLVDVNNTISGYKTGLDFELDPTGNTGATFYQTAVTGCTTAILAQSVAGASGVEFTQCTISGVTAVSKTSTNGGTALAFEDCSITGTGGTAVSSTDSAGDWGNWMSFDGCSISGTLNLFVGVFNVTNSTLSGSPQCILNSGATRAAFTGCTFSPSENITNNSGNANNLIVNSTASQANTIPTTPWSSIVDNYLSRQPANPSLFLATSYGATGNGTTDDTAAIQNALNAAGANGGGIVYLQPGLYHTTTSLTVPGGVELRGCYELRHGTWAGNNGIQQGAVIEPVGGQGGTAGPPAIILLANAGVVGVSISYETQYSSTQSSILAFPPAIQGQGANVYAIGIQCDNPYIYVDFDTYSCPNHLLYMVDGWALNTGFHIGGGSTGVIADCHANWTYWVDNYSSNSNIGSGVNQTPVLNYSAANLMYNVFGNCTETYWGSFVCQENTFVTFTSENGYGPSATLIDAYCDGAAQGYLFNSTASSSINMVNSELCIPSSNATVDDASSTSGFAGTVRMFNTAVFGSPTPYDFKIGGGDIGLELYHNQNYALSGSVVNGGVFHMVNGQFNTATNGSTPTYNFAFGSGAGISGKTSELIGLYAYDGFSLSGTIPALNDWNDYALSSYSNL